MNTPYRQPSNLSIRPREKPWTPSFAKDSLFAEQVGAGELLQKLQGIIMAAEAAERLAGEESHRVRELLEEINRQAAEAYSEVMCAVAFS